MFSRLSNSQTGIDFQNTLKEDKQNNHIINDMIISGGGVTVGDINNDGLNDLFFTGNQVPDRLYLNKGNLKFKDITKSAGIQSNKRWSSGATMGDINGDGLLDIYVCKYEFGKKQLSENLLYINQGNNKFKEEAAFYGLADRGFSVQANFIDFDHDGLLDLYLINQPPSEGNRKGNKITLSRFTSLEYTDKMFKNLGNGKFVDVSDRAHMRNLAFGLSATSGDINNDGKQDLYVANDYEKADHLYVSLGQGRFADRIHSSMKHISNFSMGSDIADINNDGFLDIGVVDMAPEDHRRIKTNMGGMNPEDFWENVEKGRHFQYMYNTLQLNNGNSSFSEIAHLSGVATTDWSWSILMADFDNDGWKDIFITNGAKRAMRNSDLTNRYAEILDSVETVAKEKGKKMNEIFDIMELVDMAPEERLPNYMYRNEGELHFSNVTKKWGLFEPNLAFGASYADLDNDGDLEIIVSNIDDYPSIYKNNARELEKQNYLRLSVQLESGAVAVGTRINIYKDGSLWQTSEVANARGYKSKSEDQIHFGLGEIGNVEKVEIRWPDGRINILENIKANQIIQLKPDAKFEGSTEMDLKQSYFTEVTEQQNLNIRHRENVFDDYTKQVLLPYKLSHFGPAMSIADVNGDGMDDFFLGGSKGFASQIMIQKRDGTFYMSNENLLKSTIPFEDMDALFFDADLDGDQDLYVSSGGYEYEENSEWLRNRFYINNGKGEFRLVSSFTPALLTNSSCIAENDFDKDGDLDLFLGGHSIPGKYPLFHNSYLLTNSNGKFSVADKSITNDLGEVGLVRDAKWMDINGDDWDDLVIVGEWMSVKVFLNNKGTLEHKENLNLEKKTGWYYSVNAADFDNDGDLDIIAGNLGKNVKYHTSESEPFEVYCGDFDDNKLYDIILSYHEDGKLFPLRGRSCSSEQLPFIAEQFPTFNAFADAEVTEILGSNHDSAIRFEAGSFASIVLENDGEGNFEVHQLPMMAQMSSINTILVDDFNLDNQLDLLIAGNLFHMEVETPRIDAGNGLLLLNKGDFEFEAINSSQSGFYTPMQVSAMEIIKMGNDRMILVANNDTKMQLFKLNSQKLQENIIGAQTK